MALATFLGTLATNIVNISLPAISNYFEIDTGLVTWVSIIYLLVLCCTIVVFGRLADIRGFKKIFLAGFAVFTIASLLCGISQNIYMLIASRALQAVGAAMSISVGPAMIATLLPPETRGKSMGYLSTAAAVGIALGPGIGGYLTTYLSWRAIFFVNIPVCLFAIILGMRVIPELPGSKIGEKLDLRGAFLLIASLASAAFAMNMARKMGLESPQIVASILVFLAFGCAFFFWERRVSEPLVDLKMLQQRCFFYANMASMMSMLVFAGAMFLLPFYLQVLRGYSADTAGLILMAPPVAMMLIAPYAGSYADKHGSCGICTAASILAALSFVLLHTIDESTPLSFVIVYLVLMGMSITLFVSPNMSFIMGNCPMHSQGIGSSLTMGIRYLGSMIGVASFGAVYAANLPGAISGSSHLSAAASASIAFAFHSSFFLGIIFSILMIIFTIAGQKNTCFKCPALRFAQLRVPASDPERQKEKI
ncbi:MAG: MFS transporter [Methanothrix sp.]